MKIKAVTLTLLIFAFMVSHSLIAASVLMDFVDFRSNAATTTSDGDFKLYWKLPGDNPHGGLPQCLEVSGISVLNGNVTTLTGGHTELETLEQWMQTVVGEVIDQQLFDKAATVFVDSFPLIGLPMRQTAPINATGNQNVYLSFVTYWVCSDFSLPNGYGVDKDNPYFGWVGLNVNGGEVSLLGSYVDLDHNPVIAGRYESAIPEPASGLLLVLGGALLALRRHPRQRRLLRGDAAPGLARRRGALAAQIEPKVYEYGFLKDVQGSVPRDVQGVCPQMFLRGVCPAKRFARRAALCYNSGVRSTPGSS